MEAIVHLIYFKLINSLRSASLTRLRSYVVRTTLEKFETGGFTLKTHQMFSVYITPAEFKNAVKRSAVILDLCLRKTRSGKSHDHRDVIVFEKLHFQNGFRPHENAKLRRFQISPV